MRGPADVRTGRVSSKVVSRSQGGVRVEQAPVPEQRESVLSQASLKSPDVLYRSRYWPLRTFASVWLMRLMDYQRPRWIVCSLPSNSLSCSGKLQPQEAIAGLTSTHLETRVYKGVNSVRVVNAFGWKCAGWEGEVGVVRGCCCCEARRRRRERGRAPGQMRRDSRIDLPRPRADAQQIIRCNLPVRETSLSVATLLILAATVSSMIYNRRPPAIRVLCALLSHVHFIKLLYLVLLHV